MAQAINPVNWFEIPVKNLERARTFYQQVLKIEMSVHEMGPLRMAWFPMVADAMGATGALVQAESYEPSHAGSMVYFSVQDIDAALKRVQEAGGSVLNLKMSIGEYGFVGHFQDSEGNRVALHSNS